MHWHKAALVAVANGSRIDRETLNVQEYFLGLA